MLGESVNNHIWSVHKSRKENQSNGKEFAAKKSKYITHLWKYLATPKWPLIPCTANNLKHRILHVSGLTSVMHIKAFKSLRRECSDTTNTYYNKFRHFKRFNNKTNSSSPKQDKYSFLFPLSKTKSLSWREINLCLAG